MSVSAKQQKEEIKVFISHRESVCDECHEELAKKAWITLVRDKGALCLACADRYHRVFLPSGDAALTRRAKKHYVSNAVDLWRRRALRRTERQGLPVYEAEHEVSGGGSLPGGELPYLR